MIPPLLFAIAFLLLAYYLWHLRQRRWMLAPLLTGIVLITLTVVIKVQDVNRVQAKRDVDVLLRELTDPQLWEVNEIEHAEKRLLLASTASQALLRAKHFYPERDSVIDVRLTELATWVTRSGIFPQWRRQKSWNEQLFFLAHAGATLAHYQLATGNDDQAANLGRVGNYLGTYLIRAKYKHLPSRPDEPFFRPADNATALYTLSLYDRLYGSEQFQPAFKDWDTYLREELYHEESRLPCAAFSVTNTCQLEPGATATGLYVAYRAAAQTEVDTDIPYREWLHYFKGGLNTPFTVSIRENMRKNQQTRFCNMGALPLDCGRYEQEIGLWAAAEYGGNYSYFRLFTGVLLRQWLGRSVDYAALRPSRRVEALQEVAFRAIGEGL
ncbi:hypothetical protein [Neolewinella antarctica]|uniref:Uncharacterized protein n=1 Tax=Neolewinella antarctica TaxID=442734 RepID=A0ABX0X934_9BACT|nr:hypothetical protein [Neolewinella antarctica]NJC25292.1 hypothetical protein [Neolewinella antarctica]